MVDCERTCDSSGCVVKYKTTDSSLNQKWTRQNGRALLLRPSYRRNPLSHNRFERCQLGCQHPSRRISYTGENI